MQHANIRMHSLLAATPSSQTAHFSILSILMIAVSIGTTLVMIHGPMEKKILISTANKYFESTY